MHTYSTCVNNNNSNETTTTTTNNNIIIINNNNNNINNNNNNIINNNIIINNNNYNNNNKLNRHKLGFINNQLYRRGKHLECNRILQSVNDQVYLCSEQWLPPPWHMNTPNCYTYKAFSYGKPLTDPVPKQCLREHLICQSTNS